MTGLDDALLAQVEDACLNASAPPQQRWLDGWLLRLSPGKARRARCVHALGPGRLPLQARIEAAAALYAQVSLPLVMRMTPFTEPPGLDAQLATLGWQREGETSVMVCTGLPSHALRSDPPGLSWRLLAADEYAAAVGALRGSAPVEIASHALRLRHSPVPYQGYAFCTADGSVQACGQVARDGHLAGLYDVFTSPAARGQGLAGYLCERLLSLAATDGGTVGYLQVDIDNAAARKVYRRLGFVDGYPYHYRQPPQAQ
jgi:ribosomal protein S18 acetylase RimI-like enzyme